MGGGVGREWFCIVFNHSKTSLPTPYALPHLMQLMVLDCSPARLPRDLDTRNVRFVDHRWRAIMKCEGRKLYLAEKGARGAGCAWGVGRGAAGAHARS